LLHLSGNMDLPGSEAVMKVFDLSEPPPPPPNPPPPPEQKSKAKPKETEGGSPANIKSQATPVQAPKPKVVIPPVPQIAASETPRQGTDPTQGAASRAGPGTGAGGSGNGTGTGTGGGPGGGGDGGVAQAPRLLSPVLTGRDIPHVLISQWPRRGTAFLRLRVDPRGYVTECAVDRGTGVPTIDSALCNLAHDRLRFRPALNRSGQPVAGWFGYAQPAPH
jgi:protein TonB